MRTKINDKTGTLDFDTLPAAEWHIDDHGLLVIAPPAGRNRAVLAAAGSFDMSVGGRAPWRSRAGDVKGVLVKPGVVALGHATGLFGGLKNLVPADVSELDVSLVDDMGSMFGFCPSLQSLDLRGWDVSHVDSMDGMFKCCSSLRSLDLSGWDVSLVGSDIFQGMNSMFCGCSSLESLSLRSWDVTWMKDGNMDSMFKGCFSLRSLDLTGCDDESAARLRALLP